MSVSKKHSGRHQGVRSLALFVLSLGALTTAQGDQLSDELDACNSDSGEAAFQNCLSRALTREDERRETKRARETEKAAIQRAAVEKRRQATNAAAVERKRQEAATAPQRRTLSAQYLAILKQLAPNYNYIATEIHPYPGGYALLGVHPLFSNLSFAAGPTGPAVHQWVRENSAALRAAHVRVVGVWRDSPGNMSGFKVD